MCPLANVLGKKWCFPALECGKTITAGIKSGVLMHGYVIP